MNLLPADLRAALRTNDAAHSAAERLGQPEPDPPPVLKLFNPLGAATWLATELADDGDALFGLADLGFGCPELGSFSLSEIAAVRLPFGITIERDIAFATALPLSRWVETARHAGLISGAEVLLHRGAADELPPSGG